MSNDTTPTISIVPALTLDDVKDGPELRTIELIHLKTADERLPIDPWTANTIEPSVCAGMNYYPHFIVSELQQVVDYYTDREFTGCIEVRNSSPSVAPVLRYYVRERRVWAMAPTLVWPGEDPGQDPMVADARALAKALFDRMRDFVPDDAVFGEGLSWETLPDWMTDDGTGRALWAYGSEGDDA